MTTVICRSCGEVHKGPFRLSREELTCPCGGHRVEPSKLKPRKPLRRVSEAKAPAARKRGSTLKRGRGFAAHSDQRKKVEGLVCVGCGKAASEYLAIDPAHLWPRGRGGCDDPLCVIPLCRLANGEGCHRLLDNGELELLPALITRGYYAELGHAISAHFVSLTTLLERVTGQRWIPANELEAASCSSLERSKP